MQGKYYVNEVDYSGLAAEYLPIAIPNGRYKIDIKLFNKNDMVASVSVLLAVKQAIQSK